MHEMAICESIVQVLEEQAVSQNYSEVKTVWLEVGPLSGIELEALRFGFDVVTRGTLAQDARLEIIETQGSAWCMACEKGVVINARYDSCPQCGGYQLQVTGGEEMSVKELEVN